jgi:hypothetical protein
VIVVALAGALAIWMSADKQKIVIPALTKGGSDADADSIGSCGRTPTACRRRRSLHRRWFHLQPRRRRPEDAVADADEDATADAIT